MLNRIKLASLFAAISLLLLAFPPSASACGGLFCRNVPIDQTAERIVFAVDKAAGTVTAIVGIQYTGSAPDFSWVVPVANPPKLEVAETKSLDALSIATNVQFVPPNNPCMRPLAVAASDSAPGQAGSAQPTETPFLKTGQIGPYDYAIIRNQNTQEMTEWLRSNGYRVTPDMEPLIAVYVKEGMYFVAMKLQRGKDANEIKPVVMTYSGNYPSIPLRLTAVAAVPNMQILVWILGDTQYEPLNYAHPQIEFERMRAGFQQVQENGVSYITLTTYQGERKFIQDRYKGRAFITEYAQPLANLASIPDLSGDGKLDPIIGGLLKKYTYITRLRAQMSPEQMTDDPVFKANANAPDVSNIVDISKYVDANTFWGCPK